MSSAQIPIPPAAAPSSTPLTPPPPPPLIEPARHRTPTADHERDEPVRAGSGELALDLDEPPSEPAPYASLDLELTPEPGEGLVGRVQTAAGLGGLGGSSSAVSDAELLEALPAPRLSVAMTLPTLTPTPSRGPADPPPAAGEPASAPSARPIISVSSTGPTQELPLTLQLDSLHAGADATAMGSPTRDFSDKPTHALRGGSRADDPLISAPTVELGLRTQRRPATDEETTREVDVHRIRQARRTGKPEIPAMDPIDARSAEILEEIDRNAPAGETREDRTRRRITALLDRAAEWGKGAELERAVTAVDLALSEDPNSALSQKLIHRNRDAIMNAFQGFLGDLQRTPALARPLHELGSAPISPRAAFLLSRVDGTLSLDEILDVSGMPRLEAYRYLCQLFLRGILR